MGKKQGRPRNPKTPEWKREFQKRNPTVSMVTTQARRQVLDQIRAGRGLSIGQVFDEFMTKKLDAGVEMLQRNDGLMIVIKSKNELIEKQNNQINSLRRDITDLQARAKRFRITFPCEVCGNPIPLKADNTFLKEIEDFIKENWDWKHVKCPLAVSKK